MAFSDSKNDSLFQKIDSNLTTDFNHSQPATVCTVLNKHFTRNGNYAFLSSLVNFFFIFISQKYDFLKFYWARVKTTKSSLFFTEFWWNGNVQIATVCTVTLSLICLVHTCTYIQFHSRLEFHIWHSKLCTAVTVLKVRLEELEQSTINTIDMCAAVHVYIQ